MLGFLCTVFPFGRKRNKPMCYIIALLPTEEMYKISIFMKIGPSFVQHNNDDSRNVYHNSFHNTFYNNYL